MTFEKSTLKAYILVEPSRKSRGTMRLILTKPFDITLRAMNVMAFDWLSTNYPELRLDDLTRVASDYGNDEELKLIVEFSIFRAEEN